MNHIRWNQENGLSATAGSILLHVDLDYYGRDWYFYIRLSRSLLIQGTGYASEKTAKVGAERAYTRWRRGAL